MMGGQGKQLVAVPVAWFAQSRAPGHRQDWQCSVLKRRTRTAVCTAHGFSPLAKAALLRRLLASLLSPAFFLKLLLQLVLNLYSSICVCLYSYT